MTQWHMKSKRKSTGGIRSTTRAEDKKLGAIGGNSSHTIIAETKRKTLNKRGKTIKVKLKSDKVIVVFDPKNPREKAKNLEILSVEENKADRQFARRKVITKGAVLKAKDGSKEVFVRVSNRPGQQGDIAGILLENFEKETQKKPKKAVKPEKTKKKEEPATKGSAIGATKGSPEGDSKEEKAEKEPKK